MRPISHVVGVSINTVTKLLVDAGNACAAYHEATVRDVKARRVLCDESGRLPTPKPRTSGRPRPHRKMLAMCGPELPLMQTLSNFKLRQ